MGIFTNSSEAAAGERSARCVLCVDSSGTSASCALYENGKLIAENFLNCGYTHSQTLLPMIDSLFELSGRTAADIGAIIFTNGPGSFTGLRIGIATVKGLAFSCDIPCTAVSTLHLLAAMAPCGEAVICPVMDARRGQVYNALFQHEGGGLRRMTDDRAISVDSLNDEIKKLNRPIYLVGDGAKLCYNIMKQDLIVTVAREEVLYQRASYLYEAADMYEAVSSDKLKLSYLRVSQAERERLEQGR